MCFFAYSSIFKGTFGGGVFCKAPPPLKHSFGLPDHSRLFQAELTAIKVKVDLLSQVQHLSVR